MTAIPSFTLNTGAKIPAIALGTWESSPEDAYDAVLHALKVGYRHIDTAHIYGNEGPVGKAIRDSGVPRAEIFLTTKIFVNQFDDVPGALEGSLKELGLDYVDLYLMHWPFAVTADKKLNKELTFIDVYQQLQKLPKDKVKAIGVSNFDVENLTKLLNDPSTKTVPATNQVELHINLNQQKLVDFCHSKDIVVEAYSPLSRGNLDDPTIEKIAKKHNVSPATVVLSWGVNRKTVVLPKSVTPKRIESNLTYIDLDKEEIEEINVIQSKTKLVRHCNLGDNYGVDTFHGDADAK